MTDLHKRLRGAIEEAIGFAPHDVRDPARLAFSELLRMVDVPEGCTPTDAVMLRHANHSLIEENFKLRETLQFYADREHFNIADPDA